MSWLGNFAGNIAGNLIGGLIGNSNASSQMNKQADINRDMYQHRYQWAVEDLKAANLNPIIAAQGGFGASAASVGVLGGSNTLAADVNSSRRLDEVDKKLADSQVLNNIAQRDNINQDTDLKQNLSKNAGIQGQLAELTLPTALEKAKQDTINSAKQGQLLDAQTLRQISGTALDAASAEAANSAASMNYTKQQLDQLDLDFLENLGGKESSDLMGKLLGGLVRLYRGK